MTARRRFRTPHDGVSCDGGHHGAPAIPIGVPGAPQGNTANDVNLIEKNAAAKCKDMDMKWTKRSAPSPSNVGEFRQYFKTMASNCFPFSPTWAYEVLERAETASSVEELAGDLTYPQFECAANFVLTNIVDKRRGKLFQEVKRLSDEYERFKKGRVTCLRYFG